ncbi:hypothetical protein AA313_de0204879 [Arthrobotrys entomopaga]|nr:hypothetical protein AA313_de0204879 [Arthrobotrys entomopaga]
MQFIDNWEQYSALDESCKDVIAEGADQFYGDIRFRSTPDDGDIPITIALYASMPCGEDMPSAILQFYNAPGYDQLVIPDEVDLPPGVLDPAFYLRLSGWTEWRVIGQNSPEWEIVEGVGLRPGEVALESMFHGWMNVGRLIVEFGPVVPDVNVESLQTDMPMPSRFTGQRAVRFMKSPPEDDLEGFAPRFWQDSAASVIQEESAPMDQFIEFKDSGPFDNVYSITHDEEWERYNPQNSMNENQNGHLFEDKFNPEVLGSLTSFEEDIIRQ